VPPRMLFGGFLEPTGHTLPRGRGYAGAGYMGADFLAQIGPSTWDAILPFVVHGAFGVTDDLTVGMGYGLMRFRGNDARFERHPYVTAKFRVLGSDRSSAAIGGFFGVFTWSNFGGFNSVFYGVSGSYSRSFAGVVALNGTVGRYGRSIDRGWQINRTASEWHVLAVGAEAKVLSRLWLVHELRSIGGIVSEEEDPLIEVLFSGLRYLGSEVSVEVGMADWLVDEWYAGTRPVFSAAYRF